MKKYLVISVLFLVGLLLLSIFSCSKDTASVEPNGYYGVDLGLWEEIPDPTLDKPEGSDEIKPGTLALKQVPGCDCAYRVVDFNYTTYGVVSENEYPLLPHLANIDAAFWSGKHCLPADLTSCLQFAGIFRDGKPRPLVNNPKCFDQWNHLPPKGLFDFNCLVQPYSSFPVNFAIRGGNLKSWSITFEIVCQNNRPHSDDPKVNGYGYVSEPITISYPGNAQTSSWGQVYVQLDKCGCRPGAIAKN